MSYLGSAASQVRSCQRSASQHSTESLLTQRADAENNLQHSFICNSLLSIRLTFRASVASEM
jgi:hypothetical protein